MIPTRQQVLDKIDTVPEPCSLLMHDAMSVKEMGLVDEVRIQDGRVEIELVLTDTSCIHLTSMSRYIADAVGELDGVDHVEVIPSTRKLWTPDRVQRGLPISPTTPHTRRGLPAVVVADHGIAERTSK
ncbi:iron-sulfur cluster assembly protein [Nocardia sp. NPDC004123]